MALADLIATLCRHNVEFIIVGGMAAILRGTPVHTFDLDVVYDRSPENIDRLLSALTALDAVARDDPRKLRLGRAPLESAGHKLLQTNQGPLDLLGTIEENTAFADLLDDSDWMEVSGNRVRVLRLERLIEVKEKLGRPKDQAVLAVLRATLEESRRPR
jgi:predicted nucleotidyltransferase